MSRKGKEPYATSSESSSRIDDACWDLPQLSLFIEVMYDHYKKGQLISSTFSEQIWREIRIELYERNRTQYTIAQLNSKANRLRMLWSKFYDLVYKRTGFGWDPTTYTVTASDDHWAEWVAANPRESGLRKKGLPHFNLCTEMFSASVATGNVARSSAMPPFDNNDDDEVDVSYPTVDPGNPFSSAAVKYPRASRGVQLKGGQSDHSNRIDTCIDAITARCKAKTRKLARISNDNIKDCMLALSKMEGLPRKLFFAAQDQFLLKVRRQMFLLMSDVDKRAWVERLGK
ncbi:UNVERIFIED_CONTAM: hypothetical protein Sindi_1708100 [Sesamum indicum]